jgi:hypothetical protein
MCRDRSIVATSCRARRTCATEGVDTYLLYQVFFEKRNRPLGVIAQPTRGLVEPVPRPYQQHTEETDDDDGDGAGESADDDAAREEESKTQHVSPLLEDANEEELTE